VRLEYQSAFAPRSFGCLTLLDSGGHNSLIHRFVKSIKDRSENQTFHRGLWTSELRGSATQYPWPSAFATGVGTLFGVSN
jgi:hypothetical protein